MIFSLEEITSALPGFELGRELGRGGYAVVLKGRERATGRRVALKVLVSDGGGEDPQDARRRFRDEAEILTHLRHPHLVDVYRLLEGDRISALVLELLEGGDLRDRRHGLDLAESCAVVLAAAEALGHAHRAGVLHRDVKPHNILFTSDGIPKVSDFGIAKVLDASMVTPSAVVGTPRYMAPEQFDLRPVGPATDIYALGLVAYELFTGHPPFDERSGHSGLMHQHLTVEPPPLAGVAPGLADVVLRALRKDPRERHRSMRAFALELAQAATGVLGPRWPERGGVLVSLDDDLRAATTAPRRSPAPAAGNVLTSVRADRRATASATPVTTAGRSVVGPNGAATADADGPDDPTALPDGRPDGRRGDRRPPAPPAPPRGRGWLLVLAGAALAVAVLVVVLVVHRGPGPEHLAASGQGFSPPATSAPAVAMPGPAGGGMPAASEQPGTAPSGAAMSPPPGTGFVAHPAVVVLNNSTVAGLGALAEKRVLAAGYPVERVANYRGSLAVARTTVYFADGLEGEARALATKLPAVSDVLPLSTVAGRLADSGRLVLVVTREFDGAVR